MRHFTSIVVPEVEPCWVFIKSSADLAKAKTELDCDVNLVHP
jgi:hypothetical protein